MGSKISTFLSRCSRSRSDSSNELNKESTQQIGREQELTERLNQLESSYQELSNRYQKLLSSISDKHIFTSSLIDKREVEKFVDELLKDPDVNLSVVPDALEKRFYVTSMTMILKFLDKMLTDNQHLSFFGHRVFVRVVAPQYLAPATD